MTTLSLKAEITTEQLFGLLSQLSTEEKLEASKVLRAEASAERWLNKSPERAI